MCCIDDLYRLLSSAPNLPPEPLGEPVEGEELTEMNTEQQEQEQAAKGDAISEVC